jgi:hypothetical protein
MQLTLRIPLPVLESATRDLKRPHDFAFERIGFLRCRPTARSDLVVVTGYDGVADDHYVCDSAAGACIGSQGIQAAMQRILSDQVGQIHIHLHEHRGPTGPSSTDWRDQPRLIASFRNLASSLPHGIIILSLTHVWGAFAIPGMTRLVKLSKVTVVGENIDFL